MQQCRVSSHQMPGEEMCGSGMASGPSGNKVGWMGSRAELGAPPWVLGGTLGGHVGLQQQLFIYVVCNTGRF